MGQVSKHTWYFKTKPTHTVEIRDSIVSVSTKKVVGSNSYISLIKTPPLAIVGNFIRLCFNWSC